MTNSECRMPNDNRNTAQPTPCMLYGHDFGVTVIVQGGRPVGKRWQQFCRRCGAESPVEPKEE